MHKRKQDLVYLNELIVYLNQTKNINLIGWEFGAAEYQKDADSIVTASEFDRVKAISLMRNSKYFWCYEDYLKVFETIWKLNKTIKNHDDKIKFLQLNKPYVQKRWDSPNKKIMIDTSLSIITGSRLSKLTFSTVGMV